MAADGSFVEFGRDDYSPTPIELLAVTFGMATDSWLLMAAAVRSLPMLVFVGACLVTQICLVISMKCSKFAAAWKHLACIGLPQPAVQVFKH